MSIENFWKKRYAEIEKYQNTPDFWISTPGSAESFFKTLTNAKIKTIGKSAGNRDIIAIEYGQKENLETTTDLLNSALAATNINPDPTQIFPESFYGKTRRKKPVIVIQGAIHGGEVTGTVGALNLCNIIETGKDLRGKDWKKLQKLAKETRLLIIPWLNPDGNSRTPVACTAGIPSEFYEDYCHGISKTPSANLYSENKKNAPINPANFHYLGAYFNDNGINLEYDFTAPTRQTETKAWMKYYLLEKPDGVIAMHTNAGSMIGPLPSFIPEGCQHEISRLSGAVAARLEGYGLDRLSWVGLPGLGTQFMSQASAIYHVCGATPVLCEFPLGYQLKPFSPEDMLDITLITFEEMLQFAHTEGFRPYEFWTKVKRKLS